MKLLLLIAVLVLVALSFVADYRWKRWIAERKRERDSGGDRDPSRRA